MARHRENSISMGALNRAVEGEETALAHIWRVWNPPLLRFFRGRSAPDPDDLAQQVWLEVAKKIRKFEGDPDAFRRWIFTLAHRRLIDAARVRQRRPQALKLVEPSADDRSGDVDGLDWALSLLRQLSDAQATAVSLRILADMSVDEVATVMGKRPGAVRALTHRGLRRLAELVREQENLESCVTQRADPTLTLIT